MSLSDYNQINLFLDKFKKILSQGENSKALIVEIISKKISFQIEPQQIKIKGSVIHINGSPMLRNEILMKKEGILSELQLQLTDRRFTDIR